MKKFAIAFALILSFLAVRADAAGNAWIQGVVTDTNTDSLYYCNYSLGIRQYLGQITSATPGKDFPSNGTNPPSGIVDITWKPNTSANFYVLDVNGWIWQGVDTNANVTFVADTGLLVPGSPLGLNGLCDYRGVVYVIAYDFSNPSYKVYAFDPVQRRANYSGTMFNTDRSGNNGALFPSITTFAAGHNSDGTTGLFGCDFRGVWFSIDPQTWRCTPLANGQAVWNKLSQGADGNIYAAPSYSTAGNYMGFVGLGTGGYVATQGNPGWINGAWNQFAWSH